ncbi:thiamine pyrophosphate-dependent dehydrogenase E1 component subunit alpha [Candidatus Methylobacter oryzae]|uniref:Thiamine pyrophosphate-dependent dehydrogenase E1 component subunit alpha n=1 Tax=Candidatus Methylobacter oryzae TaxID=2497749 RepID=A0ABY3C8W2_9GAMM|nr:thiamine pyrophosphate-dependent dehydrogenase E1 component subunit alpha [Candidatus Methylobacter oryzae]TRW92990.1 thiamine pyrophosphate-dependent dehydrogenase E1 component subunit alpha [Candidatus Methylobacter oryzae]
MVQTTADLKQLYYQMLRIRRIEEAIAKRYREQQMRCPTHLCIGEEAIAVGVNAHLSVQDKIFSNHRGHGHYLAKGGDLRRLLAELYGFAEGCCGGRGGSMHLTDLAAGFIASTPIVGGTVPLAAGYAWAERNKKFDTAQGFNVVAVFFGDGCFEEGVLHETMNFAALKKLPLLFVCENNQYSVMTRLSERQPDREIYKIAAAHGLQAASGDGNRVDEVFTLAETAIANARAGHGPQFLELHTHRWPEHCGPNEDDELGYRPPGELAVWKQRCPLLRTRQALLDGGLINDAELEAMENSLAEEIEQAFQWALQCSRPVVSSMELHLYA